MGNPLGAKTVTKAFFNKNKLSEKESDEYRMEKLRKYMFVGMVKGLKSSFESLDDTKR